MAGIVGAATNELTFNGWKRYYATKTKVQNTKARWSEFKHERPQFVSDVATGVKGMGAAIVMFFAAIGKLIRFVGWLIQIPSKVAERYHNSRA